MVVPDTWVVAHDLSPCSDLALREAARLVARLQGALVLVTVHPLMRVRPEEAWGVHTFNMTETLRARLHDLAVLERQRHPELRVRVEVVGAHDPVRGILDVVRRLEADHLVVGTHDRRGLEHLVLGSVSERVVREAPVPVIVVRAAVQAAH